MDRPKAAAKPGRKDFVRTNIPRSENIASVIILVLLVGIGVAVAIKGANFDPYLYTVRTDSLAGTAAKVDGKSQTVASSSSSANSESPAQTPPPQPSDTSSAPPDTASAPASSPSPSGGDNTSGASGEGGEGGAAPAAAVKGEPLDIALDGIKPMSDTEFYSSDTLYEKIDGRSPAYQSYNVQGLRCRSFTVLGSSGSYVDVYEYKFDTPTNAFGMFAIERDPKSKPTDFVTDGYYGESGYFFRQGNVYVQILASDTNPATQAAAHALALNRAKTLPVDDTGLAGRRSLPSTGLVSGSVQFVLENAQGQSSLNNVYQAKYTSGGAQLSFFVMVATPDEAGKAWNSFLAFCTRFGKTQALPDVGGGKIFAAQVFGKWKIVYLRGGELGGVYDAADVTKARAFVEGYLRGEIK